jgi:hypothetical protein
MRCLLIEMLGCVPHAKFAYCVVVWNSRSAARPAVSRRLFPCTCSLGPSTSGSSGSARVKLVESIGSTTIALPQRYSPAELDFECRAKQSLRRNGGAKLLHQAALPAMVVTFVGGLWLYIRRIEARAEKELIAANVIA